jgi:uncharacterized ion transporter superfamily protein YfcC
MQDSSTIQARTFYGAIAILAILLVLTGILTFVIPSGSYEYEIVDGIRTIVPDTFTYTDADPIAWWRILTAPLEVLGAEGNTLVIAIILFLLIIGGSIKALTSIGIIEHLIHSIIVRFQNNKYLLLAVLTLLFMSVGAFLGVFEEIVPLVPIVIVLAKRLGWDVRTGLGMSVLAAGFGFSAAVTNPFTIGVAQQLAGLPVFSGAGYRLVIFVVVYAVLVLFLMVHAKQVDERPDMDSFTFTHDVPSRSARIWTVIWFSLLGLSLVLSPFVPFLREYNLVVIAFGFLAAGLGAALLHGPSAQVAFQTYLLGALDMAPGVLLILLATGIRYLITIGGVMDTILFHLIESLDGSGPFWVVLGAFFFTLLANFFIGSGSAKAFLLMPILTPLFDVSGLSRQLGVLAFQFGDGFSNMFYPTNAVLLVVLGLGRFPYTKWFRWTILLQGGILLLAVLFLYIGWVVGY